MVEAEPSRTSYLVNGWTMSDFVTRKFFLHAALIRVVEMQSADAVHWVADRGTAEWFQWMVVSTLLLPPQLKVMGGHVFARVGM